MAVCRPLRLRRCRLGKKLNILRLAAQHTKSKVVPLDCLDRMLISANEKLILSHEGGDAR